MLDKSLKQKEKVIVQHLWLCPGTGEDIEIILGIFNYIFDNI